MTGDERHLLRAIELAQSARDAGNEPFGALLADRSGAVLLEAENTAITERDATGHAELNLIRSAGPRFGPDVLAGCTLYASTEPCAMCSAAIYWAGVRRVVFALGTDRFLTAFDLTAFSLTLSCREVFARGGDSVEVSGPHIEEQALAVHHGYWR